MKCANCGQEVHDPKQHEKGETPPSNEAHVDHIDPKANGGSGTPIMGKFYAEHVIWTKDRRRLQVAIKTIF
jgi:hypothetical protein